MIPEPRKRGRPPVWESKAARQQEHRQRKAAVHRATVALVLAVINAELEDPELRREVDAASAALPVDDVKVLEALTRYYRKHPWQPIRRS